jgi:hypothetical protein
LRQVEVTLEFAERQSLVGRVEKHEERSARSEVDSPPSRPARRLKIRRAVLRRDDLTEGSERLVGERLDLHGLERRHAHLSSRVAIAPTPRGRHYSARAIALAR